MFIIDDIIKKFIDIIVDCIKYRTKIKIDYINVVDSNTGFKYKGIDVINNSNKVVIISDVKILYNFLLNDEKIPMIYTEQNWSKMNLVSNDNHIFIIGNIKGIVGTSSDNYFFISLKVNNKKIIKRKIKF